jgi:hypothetical protein
LDDDVSRIELDLPAVELKADGTLEDDFEVERRRTMHARPARFTELSSDRCVDELVELARFSRRQLEDAYAATAGRRKRLRNSWR